MSSEFSGDFRSRDSYDREPLIRGKYEIREKLGEGGFGETFLAYDRSTGSRCVMKRLSWKEIPDWKTIELFEREARVLSQMDHPLIPRFIEFFTDEAGEKKHIYLVQEFIEGKNFSDLIREGRHFTEREVIEIALQVTGILEYLQGVSPAIIHRDIKPSNLLMDDKGQIHLIDFGAVRDKVLHWQKTEGSGFTVVGTYGYMPFEQFQGQAIPASDIYSLGVSLVTLLSHREPHEMQMNSSRFEFEPYVNISQNFSAVLRKMTEHRIEDRYTSASELREDLEALLAGRTPSAVQQKPEKKKNPAIWAALIASLLGVFLGFWLMRPSEVITPQAPAPIQAPVPVQPAVPKISVPAYTGPVVRGKVLFDGRPVSEITKSQPRFWFRNEKEGKVATADVTYENGEFEIRGLAPGEYGVQINFDTNPENPGSYPGDLRSWETFTVSNDSDTTVPVEVQKIMHMTKPEDNGKVLRDWGKQCETGNPKLPRKLEFKWASLGKDVFYDYSISRLSCPYNTLESVASGTVSGTSVEVQLPPSQGSEYYLLRLYARKDGKQIGMLMTHGANGYGWDYRFRVE